MSFMCSINNVAPTVAMAMAIAEAAEALACVTRGSGVCCTLGQHMKRPIDVNLTSCLPYDRASISPINYCYCYCCCQRLPVGWVNLFAEIRLLLCFFVVGN